MRTLLHAWVLMLLPAALAAQKIYVYPAAPVAPRGSFQTVTAVVNGVNDKTVTWTASGGRLVGDNPCVVNEPCTIAVYSKEPGTIDLKATSNASHATVADSTITFTPSPTPVSSHPRLIITEPMLRQLRERATPRNVAYQSIKTRAETALERDQPIWSWSCKGGSGQPRSDQSGSSKEYDANLFAFMSLVAPTESERNAWGCYGRDIWVYVMQEVVAGREGIKGNHWSDSVTQFAVTTDWLLGGNYLNASDKALAQKFLASFTKSVLGFTYGSTSAPKGYNSPRQFNPSDPQSLGGVRAMGSNYTMSKMLAVVGAALTFDDTPADDPNLPSSCNAARDGVCADFSAGSLHAYLRYFTGAMLYTMYAHLEDPTVSLPALQAQFGNLPSMPKCDYIDGSKHPCLGDGRGGESSEGSWYQYSMYRLRWALNMLHSAGYDDPLLYGPQVSMGTSSWWDMKYVSDIEFLTGIDRRSPSYNYLTTGDTLHYTRVPDDFATEASMLTADSYVGRKDRVEPMRWLLLNSAMGGPLGKSYNCKFYCGFDSELGNDFGSGLAMDLFIASPAADPVSQLPPDPRSSLPADLYNGSYNQHTILHTESAAGKVLFSTYCPNTLIDHEHEYCGRFDIFSNGEYITKGRTEFNDYNDVMSSATQSNTLSVRNENPSGSCQDNNCFMFAALENGGQFWHGQQQGFDLITHSELLGYAAFLYSDTPAYNGWWAYNTPFDVSAYRDVTKVSRSMVYLRQANELIYYDRAATGHPAPKAVYLITTGEPTVNGLEATWLTRSGRQRAFLTAVLPQHGMLARVDLIPGHEVQKDDWEPAANLRLSSGDPTAVQFLSVLQWGPVSLSKAPTSAVESSAGQSFQGAMVGAALVMFMRDWPLTFTGVTYPASGATTQYVSDLLPNMTYRITGDGAPSSARSDTAGVLTFASSGAGNIHVQP